MSSITRRRYLEPSTSLSGQTTSGAIVRIRCRYAHCRDMVGVVWALCCGAWAVARLLALYVLEERGIDACLVGNEGKGKGSVEEDEEGEE